MQGLRHAGLRFRSINRSSPLPVLSCVSENKRFFMNKTQLIDFIASDADLSQAQAKAALEATLEGITRSLRNGDQCVKIIDWVHCTSRSCVFYRAVFTQMNRGNPNTCTHKLWYANCDASVPCSRRIFFLMQGTTHWIRYIQGKIVRTRICTKHQRVKSISFYFGKGFQCQIINLHRFVFDLRQVNHRSARQGRNPKTGDTISIAASNVPAFVPGKALRESVN